MASKLCVYLIVCTILLVCGVNAKDKLNGGDLKVFNKLNHAHGGPTMVFAEELKATLDKYLFGICPPSFKMQLGLKLKNSTSPAPNGGCDPDTDQTDLAARLATLALRAHSAARGDCSHLGSALAGTFGELARTANNRQAANSTASDAAKKRKLSKSQKAKLQAKQRTALAVKKKAAAAAAAAKLSA